MVVNFGSQWTHRIWRRLRDLGCETEIVDVNTPVEELDCDGIILSGGAVRLGLGEEEDVGHAHEYLDKFNGPILGICAGQQFIALHFGGETKPSENPEYGQVEIVVEKENDLFKGVPKKFTAWASHNDDVISFPGFELLAKSTKGLNHAIKHEMKPIYGTLFHPEVEHTEHGEQIMRNFVEVCKR